MSTNGACSYREVIKIRSEMFLSR